MAPSPWPHPAPREHAAAGPSACDLTMANGSCSTCRLFHSRQGAACNCTLLPATDSSTHACLLVSPFRSFAILAPKPASATSATVLLGPLAGGKPRFYSVRVCQDGAPTDCKALQCAYVVCGPFTGLAPGKQHTVTANATLTSGKVVPAATGLPLSMPAPTAPVLLSAAPASLTSGQARAAAPASGPCASYFWLFTPLGGGTPVNATTTTLAITTAGGSLVPGGTYETRVACIISGRAAAASRVLPAAIIGAFSNTMRFVMPAPGAPFTGGEATGSTTAAVTVRPAPGAGWVRHVLTICPLGGTASACRQVACVTLPNCAATGLAAGTTHTVTTTAFRADNSSSLASNTATFTTCPADSPVRCGESCIAINSCCATNPSAGTPCRAPLACAADGLACGEWVARRCGWVLGWQLYEA